MQVRIRGIHVHAAPQLSERSEQKALAKHEKVVTAMRKIDVDEKEKMEDLKKFSGGKRKGATKKSGKKKGTILRFLKVKSAARRSQSLLVLGIRPFLLLLRLLLRLRSNILAKIYTRCPSKTLAKLKMC